MIAINEKYKKLFTNKNDRYHIVTGGRGSGKSFSVTLFLVLLTAQKNEVILFTRYTMISAHISIIPEFIAMIERLGWVDKFHITKTEVINKDTGSKILFRGIKTSSGTQTANLKSLSGVTCWVLDEAEELTDEKTFSKIDLSIRAKNKQNRVIMILNPTTHDHFIYQRWFEFGEIKNTTYIHTTYLDNKDNLSDSIITEIDRIKETNPKKYQHEILGGWQNVADGVVFENWEEGEFVDTGYTTWGMDFGFSPDPTTLVKVSIDFKENKLYVKEYLYATSLTTQQIIDVVKENLSKKDLLICDSNEKRTINELINKNINAMPCRKGDGSVRIGIKSMQDYKLIIDPQSHNMKKELRNYVWNDKKAGVPVKANDHTIDPARYCFEFLTRNYLKRF